MFGLAVELAWGTEPTARLPNATVRFLVPHDLAYARCDCAEGGGTSVFVDEGRVRPPQETRAFFDSPDTAVARYLR